MRPNLFFLSLFINIGYGNYNNHCSKITLNSY